jgi:hypothetical protein
MTFDASGALSDTSASYYYYLDIFHVYHSQRQYRIEPMPDLEVLPLRFSGTSESQSPKYITLSGNVESNRLGIPR